MTTAEAFNDFARRIDPLSLAVAVATAAEHGYFVADANMMLIAIPFDLMLERGISVPDVELELSELSESLFVLYAGGDLKVLLQMWEDSSYDQLSFTRELKGDSRVHVMKKKGGI